MLIVRENTEGEYSAVGGRMYEGTDREIVMQQTIMSRHGVDRVLKFAFEQAMKRPRKKLTSATKSNGIGPRRAAAPAFRRCRGQQPGR